MILCSFNYSVFMVWALINVTINSVAHVKQTKYGEVDMDYVLGIGGFSLERFEMAYILYGSLRVQSQCMHVQLLDV
mgnify:CR=1 FL=1